MCFGAWSEFAELYIFLVKCGKTTIEAFWAINEPHNEEKEEEKKANGSVHSKRGKIREEE